MLQVTVPMAPATTGVGEVQDWFSAICALASPVTVTLDTSLRSVTLTSSACVSALPSLSVALTVTS